MSEARFSAQSGTEYPRYSNDYSTDSKYKLRSYTYPENLFSNKKEFGNTWVMININVIEQSKYYKEDQSVGLSPEETGKRWTEADARDQTVTGGVVSGGVAGAAVGGLTALLAGKGSVGVGIGAVQGGAAGAIATAPMAIAGTAKRSTKRLASAIQLPMPNGIMSPYSVGWNPDSTKIFDIMMRVPGMTAKTVKNIVTGNVDGLKQEGSAMLDLGASAALSMNSAAGNGGVSAASGLASNPKKEMIFDGVDFRNFTMDYVFYPKNHGESLYIKNIIDLLKFHMHPEYMSKDRFTFIYPSEFDITFFMGDSVENPWVNRVATSVLTNMTVNYTPQGVWAVHEDGSPVMIQISLTFKELSIITKENLNNPSDESAEIKASY
jgi:hypothetical protein